MRYIEHIDWEGKEYIQPESLASLISGSTKEESRYRAMVRVIVVDSDMRVMKSHGSHYLDSDFLDTHVDVKESYMYLMSLVHKVLINTLDVFNVEGMKKVMTESSFSLKGLLNSVSYNVPKAYFVVCIGVSRELMDKVSEEDRERLNIEFEHIDCTKDSKYLKMLLKLEN